MSRFFQGVVRYRLLLGTAAFAASLAVVFDAPVSTTVTKTAPLTVFSGTSTVWEPDVAYDPVNQRFLAVFKYFDKVWGLFLTPGGAADGAAFQILATNSSFPRVAGRTQGSGGFLVTYYDPATNSRQALFIQPGAPTQISAPVIVKAGITYEHEGSGITYAPDYDVFLATYPDGGQTYVVGVRPNLTMTNAVKVSAATGACSSEFLTKPEIAYDAGSDTAMVAGWRDASECSFNGGIWSRLVSFNGTTLTALGQPIWLVTGGLHEDMRVDFSAAAQKFVAAWSFRSGNTRSVYKRTVDLSGNAGTLMNVLPPNLTNSSPGDDAFNYLGMAYNAATGRFVLAMRGNDCCGSPLAPAYMLELDANGDAVPGTLAEIFNNINPPRPYPTVVAKPGSAEFLVMAKSPGELQLMTTLATGNGMAGSTWPANSGTPVTGGGGGGGGGGTTSYTLTITKPTGGTILGPDIWCGDAGNLCQITRAAGTVIELVPIPSGSNALTSWGGCAASFSLNSSLTCAPTFSGSGGGGGGGGGTTFYTLTITRPTGGTILGQDIWCGDGGASCSVTRAAGTIIELVALPAAGKTLTSWGGCAASFPLNSSLTCAPTFSGTTSGGGGGGGGTTFYTLTITRPSGGTILGKDIWCGDGGSLCQVTRAAGTIIELVALPSGSNVLTSWGGCAPSFTLNSSLNCAPTFGSSGGSPPPPPPPSGTFTLSLVNPGTGGGGGFILGPEIFCNPGNQGLCSRTFSTTVTISLTPVPYSGFYFGGWVEAGCTNTMTLSSSKTCTANFNRF
jgi:hypothetical protein